MTIIDRACFERGCACHDLRVDGAGVEVVAKQWQGLTQQELNQMFADSLKPYTGHSLQDWASRIEAKLREKNA